MEEADKNQNDVDKTASSSSGDKSNEGIETGEAIDSAIEKEDVDPNATKQNDDLDDLNVSKEISGQDDREAVIPAQEMEEADEIQADGKTDSPSKEKTGEGIDPDKAFDTATDDTQSDKDPDATKQSDDIDDPISSKEITDQDDRQEKVETLLQEMEGEKKQDDVGGISDTPTEKTELQEPVKALFKEGVEQGEELAEERRKLEEERRILETERTVFAGIMTRYLERERRNLEEKRKRFEEEREKLEEVEALLQEVQRRLEERRKHLEEGSAKKARRELKISRL